jgi:hypothetical protein
VTSCARGLHTTEEQLDFPVYTTSVTSDTPISTDCGMHIEINVHETIKDIKLVAARPDIHCKHMYLAGKNRYRNMNVKKYTDLAETIDIEFQILLT